MKIGIIGGGASGLISAITAKKDNNEVVIFEKEKRVGRKILATGNGRCNMTNTGACEDNYHSGDIGFIRGAINRFWVEDTLALFDEMGILWKEEEKGKVYPYSDTASSVLDVLRRTCEKQGIRTECEFAVSKISKTDNGFEIRCNDGRSEICDRVIIATGGKAGSSLGSDGSGYGLVEEFGHTVTPLYASLVQLKTETEFVRKLKGIKVNAKVTLNGRTEEGELLFTDYGLSGPPVFSLSSYLSEKNEITIDFMPEYSVEDLYGMICSRCAYLYDVCLEDFFVGMLNKRVGQALLKQVGIAPLSRLASSLSEKEINLLVSGIKGLKLKITGTASWNNAQVTKGGATVTEFNSATMESKLQKGLYACGEILDVDGDCGGYNLQWAWSSGYLAGLNASKG